MPAFTHIESVSNTFEIRKIRSWLKTSTSPRGKILTTRNLNTDQFLVEYGRRPTTRDKRS